MRSDIAWVPQLASQGAARERRQLAVVRRSPSDALPGPLATTKSTTARSYALPLDTNTQALFWNKADFAAAGIIRAADDHDARCTPTPPS